MHNPAPLLAAICDDPDDVVSRLAYADWLEDSGDPAKGAHDHAEFIRLQIALDGLDLDDPTVLPQVRRERELRKRLNPRLKDEVRAGRDAVYRNGFIEGLTLTVGEFLRLAPALFTRIPLRHVRFHRTVQCNSGLADLFASPYLGRLRGIGFRYYDFGNDVMRQLAECPHLGNLDTLGLQAHIDVLGSQTLAEAPFLSNLRVLNLEGAWMGDDGVAALVGSDGLTCLEDLNLRFNRLSASGVRTLAESAGLARLRALDLKGNLDVGAAGVEALVTSVPLTGLKRLTLDYRGDPEAARVFSAASRPGSLRWLLLRPGGFPPSALLGDEGAAALAAAPWLTNLRALHLAHNGIGAAGTRALASTSHFANLHTLGLGDNPIGDEGAKALAGSYHLTRLRSLRLRRCRIGSTGAKALAASLRLSALDLLELKDNPIRKLGAEALRERFGEAVSMTEPKGES